MKKKKLPVVYDVRKLPATVDTETAAAVLGCHPTWLRLQFREGKIPGYRNGKNWRMNKTDLLKQIGETELIEYPIAQ